MRAIYFNFFSKKFWRRLAITLAILLASLLLSGKTHALAIPRNQAKINFRFPYSASSVSAYDPFTVPGDFAYNEASYNITSVWSRDFGTSGIQQNDIVSGTAKLLLRVPLVSGSMTRWNTANLCKYAGASDTYYTCPIGTHSTDYARSLKLGNKTAETSNITINLYRDSGFQYFEYKFNFAVQAAANNPTMNFEFGQSTQSGTWGILYRQLNGTNNDQRIVRIMELSVDYTVRASAPNSLCATDPMSVACMDSTFFSNLLDKSTSATDRVKNSVDETNRKLDEQSRLQQEENQKLENINDSLTDSTVSGTDENLGSLQAPGDPQGSFTDSILSLPAAFLATGQCTLPALGQPPEVLPLDPLTVIPSDCDLFPEPLKGFRDTFVAPIVNAVIVLGFSFWMFQFIQEATKA